MYDGLGDKEDLHNLEVCDDQLDAIQQGGFFVIYRDMLAKRPCYICLIVCKHVVALEHSLGWRERKREKNITTPQRYGGFLPDLFAC